MEAIRRSDKKNHGQDSQENPNHAQNAQPGLLNDGGLTSLIGG
jgi:hypothetical protein